MLIGRQSEQNILKTLLEEEESQFCAIYGRRRVGKTYLVRETFNYNFAFQHTGAANEPLKKQLENFHRSLMNCGMGKCARPKNWMEAFNMLAKLLETKEDKKKVVFIDELPWMDTPKSGLISALEHFWNSWATARREKDIILIVCGSATSWITDNIKNNHGGLHNRLTRQIYLKPFSLLECEKYAKARNLVLERKQIAELYMVLGGIPFYWSMVEKSDSVQQCVDRLFFHEDAKLKNEFESLYASLFKKPEPYIKIVTALGSQKSGLSRDEIIKATGLSDNGSFSKQLNDLELCGFVRKYKSYGKTERNELIQLIDNYTLFYFKCIKENINGDTDFWLHNNDTQIHNTWAGLAFERLCLQHIEQIKKALGISGVICSAQSWRTSKSADHDGAQIDLLLVRNDSITNIIEMKYSKYSYRLNGEDIESLMRKRSVFKNVTQTKSSVHITMATTYGVEHNAYWNDIQSEITLDDLFQ